MKKLLFGAALAALCLATPAYAQGIQYDLQGNLTSTTCNGTGNAILGQEAGCLVMGLGASVGSVSVQVSINGSTLQFEVSDNGTNYVSANGYPVPSGIAVTSTTTTGIWQVDTAGTKFLRVRASSFGTLATLNLAASLDPVVGVAGTQTVAGGVANDTTAIGNGVETQPGVARASPTAVTAGRSEKLQQSATNGAVFSSIVGGASTTVVDAFANDTTAIGNGLQVHPGIAKTAPTAITAGRSELLELDAATGAQFVGEAATTTNTAATPVVVSVNTATNVKASAGNVYGANCANANASICYLQFYNTAGSPTCGTSVVWSMAIPTSGVLMQPVGPIPLGNFATGIAVCMDTTQTGASACASANSCTIFIK